MKKFICTALTLAMVVGSLAGCGSSSSKKQQQQAVPLRKLPQKQHRQKLLQQQAILIQAKKSVLTHVKIGSGTRGAFIELFGVEEKAADGTKVDNTTVEANITNSTSVMIQA